MAPLNSREPGTVGGVLANDQLFSSVIADGVHVHLVSLRVVVRAKSSERVVLITDGMPPVGTNSNSFMLDGETIQVHHGACYRPDGVLAGSVLTMDQAVRYMHEAVGVPLADAIAMATLNPAHVLGLSGRKGSIEEGYDADIVIIDRNVNVWMTIVEGRIRYRVPD
jgi:N-acetylglucosamine-6-phosphate deacetylase